jgi:hypothetical protein
LINAFYNYLKYDTLEVTQNYIHNVLYLIASNLSITDNNFEQIDVRRGENNNESTIAKQSATQSCKCFQLFRRKLLIPFIDTPAIGDTRRINADNNNMENIHLSVNSMKFMRFVCFLSQTTLELLSILSFV